jgi:death-on-curing protein
VNDWIWIDLAAVLAAHDRLIAEYGGLDGVRDMGGLESALSRPRNLVLYGDRPDIADLAASYAVGLAGTQHYADGNKRAAWATARAFLRLNGYGVAYDKAEAVEITSQVAEKTVSDTDLSQWFRDRLRRL